MKKLLGSVFDFGVFFGLCWLFAKNGALTYSHQSLVVFAICAYTVTTIIVDSNIAQPFCDIAGRIPVIGPGLYVEQRDNEGNLVGTEGLLSCPLCTGMWVGIALAWCGIAAFPALSAVDYVAHGALAAGVSYVGSRIVHKFLG